MTFLDDALYGPTLKFGLDPKVDRRYRARIGFDKNDRRLRPRFGSDGTDTAAAAALQAALPVGSAKTALVSTFQAAYNANDGTPALVVDGYWGPKTAAALAQYDVANTAIPIGSNSGASLPTSPGAQPAPSVGTNSGASLPTSNASAPAVGSNSGASLPTSSKKKPAPGTANAPPPADAQAALTAAATALQAAPSPKSAAVTLPFQRAYNAAGMKPKLDKEDGIFGAYTAVALAKVTGQPAPVPNPGANAPRHAAPATPAPAATPNSTTPAPAAPASDAGTGGAPNTAGQTTTLQKLAIGGFVGCAALALVKFFSSSSSSSSSGATTMRKTKVSA